MFCLRNQDITDAKAFFYLFFMSNSGYLYCSSPKIKSKQHLNTCLTELALISPAPFFSKMNRLAPKQIRFSFLFSSI